MLTKTCFLSHVFCSLTPVEESCFGVGDDCVSLLLCHLFFQCTGSSPLPPPPIHLQSSLSSRLSPISNILLLDQVLHRKKCLGCRTKLRLLSWQPFHTDAVESWFSNLICSICNWRVRKRGKVGYSYFTYQGNAWEMGRNAKFNWEISPWHSSSKLSDKLIQWQCSVSLQASVKMQVKTNIIG